MKNLKIVKNLPKKNTSERILHQAMRIFLDKGYHGTSIDDITKAAGITKGSLYWHFSCKEDILRKIIEEFENRFLDKMIRQVEEVKGGALDKFHKYFNYNANFAYYNRELCVTFTTLAAELLGARRGRTENEMVRIYKKYRKFLSSLFAQGKKERVFKKNLDTDLTALVIMALHDGILLHWSMNRNEINGEAYVSSFRKVILNGVIA